MSNYRNKLQEALLHSPTHNSPTHNFSLLYTVCETLAYAAFLAGWAVLIIGHI